MIGRQVEIVPGSYQRVVCIGAGALRLYSYVGDVSLLCGVEDIDNTTLEERPKMFDGVARPYVMVYGDTFAALPSCGVGGPNAQAAEAEKILSCTPDIIVSEYEDTDKAEALQQQVGVPVITLRTGVDGVFIGPADLSASMGHPGNPGHPEVQAAIHDGIARILRAGKAPGILATTESQARQWLAAGALFVAVGVDTMLLGWRFPCESAPANPAQRWPAAWCPRPRPQTARGRRWAGAGRIRWR
jgi:hypothetical protein